VEAAVLNPLRDDLLAPERVAKIAREMQRMFVERVRAIQSRAATAPKELADLDARITRLRERLKHGDPDLAADEIEAAGATQSAADGEGKHEDARDVAQRRRTVSPTDFSRP
jgi:hypothetical protein